MLSLSSECKYIIMIKRESEREKERERESWVR